MTCFFENNKNILTENCFFPPRGFNFLKVDYKWWGKLVNELIYGYLDEDVFNWLKSNAPKPRHGQNYHQWLSSQYGLKKLIEHIWMTIGMARACHRIEELRERMAIQYGRHKVQLSLFVPIPATIKNKPEEMLAPLKCK